jgi:hypothetical protein
MPIKVEITETAASRLVEQWREKLLEVEWEAEELRTNIASVEAQLNGKLHSQKPGSNGVTVQGSFSGGTSIPSEKRAKGQNVRAVQSYLQSVHPKGATLAEVHKRAGVPLSSTQLVLKRHADIFTKGSDGLWRLK